MYTGALPAQSSRATRNLTVTLTDDNGAAVDLTGATFTVGVREPESKLPRASYSSPSAHLAITNAVNGVPRSRVKIGERYPIAPMAPAGPG